MSVHMAVYETQEIIYKKKPPKQKLSWNNSWDNSMIVKKNISQGERRKKP